MARECGNTHEHISPNITIPLGGSFCRAYLLYHPILIPKKITK
jgi:hypothetical protein